MSHSFSKILSIPDEFAEITSGVLLSDDKYLVTGHTSGDIVKWNMSSGEHEILHQCSSPVTSITVSKNDEIAVGCHSGLLFTFTLSDTKMSIIQEPAYGKTSRIWRTIWGSPNSLFVTSTYGVFNLFERGEQWQNSKISGHTDSIFALASIENRFIASGDWRGKIIIRENKEGILEILDEINLQGTVEAISWHKEGAFATIDEYGHINYFEKNLDGSKWRSVFETDIALSRGTSVLLTEDGMTVFAGTNTELIQFDIDTQQIQSIPIENIRSIFSTEETIFVLTDRELNSFERRKVEVPDTFVKYQYSKVSLVGHTGSGKTTLASMITSGSANNIKSTYGKRVWNWNVSVKDESPERRIVLHDHGGQETVLDTFLPFLTDSDMILIFFKKNDRATFEKALKIRKELESLVTAKCKIFLVETFIDHELNDIDETILDELTKNQQIISCLKVSPATSEGIDEFKQKLIDSVDWNNTRTMIRSEYVESMEKSLLDLIESKSTVLSFAALKKYHETRSGQWMSTNHMKFLLTNFSSQGAIEYYPEVLDVIIFNDERYNELRSKIPIAVEQKNGIISLKELQDKFDSDITYVMVLDQVYRSYGIAVENATDLRIFPGKLKEEDIVTIKEPFQRQLKDAIYNEKIEFPNQTIDHGQLISALSEMGLVCIDASKGEGIFAWETNACIYYKFEEAGNAITGHSLRFTYVIGGVKKSVYDRLNSEFITIVEALYGPNLEKLQSKKKDLKITKFDVALSFAGEQREYVDQVAKKLRSKAVRVFYDEFFDSYLWGKDLTEYFQKVYYANSNWCIMFISEQYVSKIWPTYERKNAMAKEIEVKDGYILPVRFDDTEVPGLNPLIHYQDARKKTPQEIVDLFLEKFEAE